MTFDLKLISREAPVLLAGPTASGKSAFALELAARDGRVVVNADALQVYGCWRVLTARPSVTDEAAQPHALYGYVGRGQPYSVGHWLRRVTNMLDLPVVIVGGTGLYFTALTEAFAPVPEIPEAIRTKANALRLNDLPQMRAGLDPETAARIDLANPMRVQRAWEVLHATGRGLAAWQSHNIAPVLPLAGAEALVIRPDVGWLDARIARRFAAMLREGALDEVRAALPHWDPVQPWAKAIGAPELVAHLRGQISLAEAADAATLASRQYAKRQRTWLRSRMKAWREISLP